MDYAYWAKMLGFGFLIVAAFTGLARPDRSMFWHRHGADGLPSGASGAGGDAGPGHACDSGGHCGGEGGGGDGSGPWAGRRTGIGALISPRLDSAQ